MGAKLGSGGGLMADMNVTPLIDVVLVLLVVFMVITPMLQSGLAVELPTVSKATTANKVNASEFITVSVTLDGRWGVEQETVTPETLIDELNLEFAKDGQRYSDWAAAGQIGDAPQPRMLLIKADGELEYEKVREVMDLLSANKLTALRLAVNEDK